MQEVDTALLRVLAERNAPELYELLDDPRLTLAVEDAEATLRSLKVRRCARGQRLCTWICAGGGRAS